MSPPTAHVKVVISEWTERGIFSAMEEKEKASVSASLPHPTDAPMFKTDLISGNLNLVSQDQVGV